MYNSWYAFLFSTLISILVIFYVQTTVLYNRKIEKSINTIENNIKDLEIIEKLPTIFNDDTDKKSKQLIKEVESLSTEDLTINIEDISSRMNLNFFDFTMFKEPILQDLLNNKYSWLDLQNYRDEVGFVTNIEAYRHFFKEDVEFDKLVTVYNLPNINNSSDLMIEKFYSEYTLNSGAGENLKSQLVNNRKKQLIINETIYKSIFLINNDEIRDVLTILPNWNINYIPEQILKVYLYKKYQDKNITNYASKYSNLISSRNSKELTIKDVETILNLQKSELGLLTYIGDKTTFYKVSLTTNSKITNIILGWFISKQEYKIVSISREIL